MKKSNSKPVATNVPAADYSDRSRAMTAETRTALISSLLERMKLMHAKMEDNTVTRIEVANMAREMGREIEMFTGHQKLLPMEFGSLSSAMTTAGGTPPGITFAKECLSAHMAYPEPIKDISVANRIYERLEQLMLDLPKPEHGEQTSHPQEPVREFYTEFMRLTNHVKRIKEQFEKQEIDPSELDLYMDSILKQIEHIDMLKKWILTFKKPVVVAG